MRVMIFIKRISLLRTTDLLILSTFCTHCNQIKCANEKWVIHNYVGYSSHGGTLAVERREVCLLDVTLPNLNMTISCVCSLSSDWHVCTWLTHTLGRSSYLTQVKKSNMYCVCSHTEVESAAAVICFIDFHTLYNFYAWCSVIVRVNNTATECANTVYQN